jgi:cytolysin-activating lysine-acyltransferase
VNEETPNATAPAATQADAAHHTVAHYFGEIVWLATRSSAYKHYSLADLEWLVMPALLLRQFRLIHAGQQPASCVLWARLNQDAASVMANRHAHLRPDQWRCGEQAWILNAILPDAAPEAHRIAAISDCKQAIFPNEPVFLRNLAAAPAEIPIIRLDP